MTVVLVALMLLAMAVRGRRLAAMIMAALVARYVVAYLTF
jgi:hypothetical protein